MNKWIYINIIFLLMSINHNGYCQFTLQEYMTNEKFAEDYGLPDRRIYGNLYALCAVKFISDPAPSEWHAVPSVLCLDLADNRIVWRYWNSLVQRFGYKGFGRDAGVTFKNPRGITANSDGDIFVSDTGNHRIVKLRYNSNNIAYISEFGGYGSNPGQFINPTSIKMDRDNNIYVVDSTNSRIQKFDITGSPLKHFVSQVGKDSFVPHGMVNYFGTYGDDDYGFRFLTDVSVSYVDGSIYVLDMGGPRILKYNPGGIFQKALTPLPDMEPNPVFTSIDTDFSGYLYIVDSRNKCLYVLDSYFNFITKTHGNPLDPYGTYVSCVALDKSYEYKNGERKYYTRDQVYVSERKKLSMFTFSKFIENVNAPQTVFVNRTADASIPVTISFDINTAASISVIVMKGGSVLGYIVLNQYNNPGNLEYVWDARVNGNILPDDVYTIRINASFVDGTNDVKYFDVRVSSQQNIVINTSVKQNEVHENDLLTYITTINNIGDETTAVELLSTYPKQNTFIDSSNANCSISGDYILWNIGDMPQNSSLTITYTMRADPKYIFKSDFSCGELPDDWRAHNYRPYFINQDKLLVTSPVQNVQANWIHTRKNIYLRKMQVEGSVVFNERSQSSLMLTKNGNDPAVNDYIKIYTDVSAETAEVRVFNNTRAVAHMPSSGSYKFKYDFDFNIGYAYAALYETGSDIPLVQYTLPTDEVTSLDSLYFGIYNNFGSILLNDDIEVKNTNRFDDSDNPVNISTMTSNVVLDDSVTISGNSISATVYGHPQLNIEKALLTTTGDISVEQNTNTRLTYEENQPITYIMKYTNIGEDTATNVRIWDTVSASLSITSAEPNAGNVTDNYLLWNIGNMPVSASRSITLKTVVKTLNKQKNNILLSEDFNYGDSSKLFDDSGLWKSETEGYFQINNRSEIEALSKTDVGSMMNLKNGIFFGDDLVRAIVKVRMNEYGAAQVVFMVGDKNTVSVQTDADDFYINVFDDTIGEHIHRVGKYVKNETYYYEYIYNRIRREANIRIVDSSSGQDVIDYDGKNMFYATNLSAYPEINIGFRALNYTSLFIDSITIISEDIDQSSSIACDENNIKRTSVPHLFAWVEKPLLVLSKTGIPSVPSGDAVPYTIIIQNHGSVNADNVIVTDTLPSSFVYYESSPAPSTVINNCLIWNINSIDAFSQYTITLSAQPSITNTNVTNQASVIASNSPMVVNSNVSRTLLGEITQNAISSNNLEILSIAQITPTPSPTNTPTPEPKKIFTKIVPHPEMSPYVRGSRGLH